jgi:hypothetical protein
MRPSSKASFFNNKKSLYSESYLVNILGHLLLRICVSETKAVCFSLSRLAPCPTLVCACVWFGGWEGGWWVFVGVGVGVGVGGRQRER